MCHHIVLFGKKLYCFVVYLKLKKPVFDKKLITFTELRSVYFNNFGSDVLNSSFRVFFAASLPCLDDLIIHYNDVLSSVLDIHAPARTKTVTLHPAIAWYFEEMNSLKNQRRRLERRWTLLINALPSTT